MVSSRKKSDVPEHRQPAHVLLVDDHPIVRRGLRELIDAQADLAVCGEAEGGTQALRQIDELKPDVILIDISLKDSNGLELIKQVKAREISPRMLVVSMHSESLFAERALRAGAGGYVSKDAPAAEILGAIRMVLAGKVAISPSLSERLLTRLVGADGQAAEDPVMSLSDRELEVFQLIGQALTTKAIAGRLHLSPKTVETYRENIKTKLSLANANELTQRAVQWVMENS
ncbi:MAG: response regulator transcription factor [Planctomycetes bacterium]|nr:response regulator transcription factor [Planctomycetota bacterium]